MIQSVTITNHLNESITITLRSPEQSGFLVVDIDGLGPVKANINMTEVADLDGAIYNSASADKRNIVFTLKFFEFSIKTIDAELGDEPNVVYYDIEDIRQMSYKYFPLKKRIKIKIVTDNRTSEVYGYVESNEPTIFSSEEGCIISVICGDSYLFDINFQSTSFSSVTPLFEFPFSNESLTLKLLEMGSISLDTTKVITYVGDASIGMLIHIHAIGAANDVVITDAKTLETLSISSAMLIAITGADISTGDDIYISTVRGNKYAILIRSTTEYNILSALGQNPTWFQLEKGDNIYSYSADSGIGNLQFETTNDVAYEGI